MLGTDREIACGCRLCGCVCAEHTAEGIERLCAAHANKAVFRFVIDEARRLVVLALFVGVLAIGAAVLSTM